ncbi:aromatic-amino-acid transaminase [Meinhardsimonia xiamenensis]|jgi:aromatic-amino-acid transaminase|uniref:Aromatic-amino-acid transaminase n=1 Tax=Meinhardsimonia xiamenensis TaxID=990712 RepID=A0A1G8YF55_9RHOB|nr:amino acid aminotransferase [Meinhardsimonia xiamenensis]PRX37256.1 aromatic-amino-acid transaminase [Meinhardsimonia xiamenensis]SDK00670.1 aromatic-amino-acid transaminase [Meinhardsimonia xiamenensis]
MLENLQEQPKDKILALMEMFRADPRAEKIDLGVGVYRNAQGVTPIMRAVKAAEKTLWETEETKAYTGLAGDPAFAEAMRGLVLGDAVEAGRVAAAATPGGTGAIRQGLELIRLASPGATIWLSAPTWPNHPSIIRYLGMPMREYRYFDAAARGVDFEGMMADLAQAKPGDVVLLHGCCHNPTGANLTLPQWQEVAALLEKTGATPFIDIAYQGFGDGLEEDAAGTRLIAARLPETIIAASCSKNFGIYRERTGILMAVAENAARKPVVQGNLAFLNRQNFSFPPDHGARLVTMILNDAALRADWQAELEEMRLGMLRIREALAAELRRLSGSDRFGFIAQHRGMFSLIGASPEQVELMREKHGIYMVGDSRINIAGLTEAAVPKLAAAIIDAGV